MKKFTSILSILLILTVLLSACAGEPEPTIVPTTEPTAAPTTDPTVLPTEPPTEPPTESTGLPNNTWTNVSAILVNNEGQVLENLELTVNAMTWEEDGRGYYNLRFDYPETIHNSGQGVLPYGDYEYPYTCSNGIGAEKGPEGKHAWTYYVGFDPKMGCFIVDFDDGEDVYLIAYWGMNDDVSALWGHFQDFIAMRPENFPKIIG